MSGTAGATRPAHRPSRRRHIIDASMELFARTPFDEVTVADIAEAAGMTSTAVYYHFAGKEQIVLEGTRTLTDTLVEIAASAGRDGVAIGALMTLLINDIRMQATAASVYFVRAAGLNLALEAHRKTVRAELAELFADAARRTRPELPTADAGVMGAALVSLLEVSAVAMLGQDRAFVGFCGDELADTMADLARSIVGS